MKQSMDLPGGQNMLIRDRKKFDAVLEKMRADGPDKLHLLLDYDGTITHEWDEQGNPRPTLIATLRMGNYLNEEYSREAHALADHYKKIEKDPTVEFSVKKALMQEWWEKHYALLIKHRLNRNDISRAMQDSKLRTRNGMAAIIRLAAERNVPVVIMSANGLGVESVRWHLQHTGLYLPNVQIVSNDLVWDEQGYMTGYCQPIIHSLSKDETVLTDLPELARLIDGRTNIIQMGDGLGDKGMASGIKGTTVLSVGFYNDKTPDKLARFEETFDLVLTGDTDAVELKDLLDGVL